MRVQTRASLPTSQASPPAGAQHHRRMIAGLILGIGAAFAAQVLDPRLRREEQLRASTGCRSWAASRSEPAAAGDAAPPQRHLAGHREAYRRCARPWPTRPAATTGQGRVILVTGSSPSEGKSTTRSTSPPPCAAGQAVILIESDLRRPSLGRAFGVTPEHGGVVSVLIENISASQGARPDRALRRRTCSCCSPTTRAAGSRTCSRSRRRRR